jgi:hypothetical protein
MKYVKPSFATIAKVYFIHDYISVDHRYRITAYGVF